ncbi:MAG: PASTA domain-containing protein [Clostridia bacterium]|nr:PASTA domain-containing protein [Clostridia bacterium]
MPTAGPTRKMWQRMVAIMLTMVIITGSVMAVRLAWIMVVNGEEYQAKASAQQLHDAYITAERGNIYDSTMNLLAKSSTVWTIYSTPNDIAKIKDPEEKQKVINTLTEGLSSILSIEKEEVEKKLGKTTSYYVEIKKKVGEEETSKVREFLNNNSKLGLANYIGIDESSTRYYAENIASTVLGFVGDDNQGLSGLELKYDEELTGVAGRVVAAKNAVGADMPFSYEKVVDEQPGNSLVTTIDPYVQYVVEKHLDAAVKDNKVAERGACVIMNVNTGAILAMATKGDFDCNSPFTLSADDQAIVDALEGEERSKKLAELRNRQWRNKVVSDAYEPGSVFKVITAAIGIEEGVASLNTTCNCPGYIVIAGRRYNCHKETGHGMQDMKKAMDNSCNPFFISLGQTIGTNIFSKYFKAFGLTEKTGIDLTGEAASQYHLEQNMGPTELGSSAFGQTFKITPIQLITAISATVNGGTLVKPRVVEKIIDSEGNVVKNLGTVEKRQVISKETSKIICDLMESVVAEGGGQNAYVPGYRIGGKTGTAQKVSEMLSTGKQGLYVASFCGVAPMNDPEIAILFLLDEPHGDSYYGGTISAPPGGQILAEILPYLGYEPQYTEEELKDLAKTVPNVAGLDIAAAKNAVKNEGISYKVIGGGEKVVKQLPAAGNSVYSGGVVILYTDSEAPTETVKVPLLTGMTISQVNSVAVQYGLNVSFKGNTNSAKAVVSFQQSIAAETEVERGTVIEVYFRSNETGDIGG